MLFMDLISEMFENLKKFYFIKVTKFDDIYDIFEYQCLKIAKNVLEFLTFFLIL